MLWYLNDAASRQVRRYIGNYVKAQETCGCRYACSQPMPTWIGMAGEEWARWVANGEVSDRYMRVLFHGHELRYPDGHVELWDTDREEQMVRVPLREGWRGAMMAKVRKGWPGFADSAQAYIETQSRR